MVKVLIRAMRPYQGYKNLLLFVGIIFSHNLLNTSVWSDVILAFIIFCLLSGSGYIINDIVDLKEDRIHPTKSKRPIAAGQLKVHYAITFSVALIIIALVGAYWIGLWFFGISILFLLLTLAYSFWLKHIILIDVLVISIGFVIRVTAGSVAISTATSPWVITCALLLALLLALGKRRHEVILLGGEAKSYRKTLKSYSVEILGMMMGVTAAVLIMSYALHTFLTGSLWMMVTIPVVIYSVFRYLFLVYVGNLGGEPELILKDKEMVISIVLWSILSIVVLYILPEVAY